MAHFYRIWMERANIFEWFDHCQCDIQLWHTLKMHSTIESKQLIETVAYDMASFLSNIQIQTMAVIALAHSLRSIVGQVVMSWFFSFPFALCVKTLGESIYLNRQPQFKVQIHHSTNVEAIAVGNRWEIAITLSQRTVCGTRGHWTNDNTIFVTIECIR